LPPTRFQANFLAPHFTVPQNLQSPCYMIVDAECAGSPNWDGRSFIRVRPAPLTPLLVPYRLFGSLVVFLMSSHEQGVPASPTGPTTKPQTIPPLDFADSLGHRAFAVVGSSPFPPPLLVRRVIRCFLPRRRYRGAVSGLPSLAVSVISVLTSVPTRGRFHPSPFSIRAPPPLLSPHFLSPQVNFSFSATLGANVFLPREYAPPRNLWKFM